VKKIFWGSGTVGLSILKFWRTLNNEPDYFCDNDRYKWGTVIDGILVISPFELKTIENAKIYITCSQYEEILQQLLQAGIKRKNIITANTEYSLELVLDIEDDICSAYNSYKHEKDYDEYECLIELPSGMVLGGVERWSYSFAKQVEEFGIKASYVGPKYINHTLQDGSAPYCGIDDRKGNYLLNCMEFLIQSKAKYIIGNSPYGFVMAARIVKNYYNPSLKIVGIVHGDVRILYERYAFLSEDLDDILAVSSKIEGELLEVGIPKRKIRKLLWDIMVPLNKKREYSKESIPIKIGYAGRIVTEDKRMDYIVPIAMALKNRNVDFKMQMAGTGLYEEELKQEIQNHGLDDKIELLGLIAHDKIFDFWLNQDVCLSCSDTEGHCISHSEAIAVGTVPVFTNTSGVEDDVIDGETGYIVDIGDIDAIADKIAVLYQDKKKLRKIGHNILKRNEEASRKKICEQNEFWKTFFAI
jgi:glycosyltransferase involved in cell wall biosynthesis